MIVIYSIIFSLYVCGFLIVRDECERLVNTQASKDEQVDFTTGTRLSREKLTRERPMCRAHDWKMKSHARLEVFASVSWVRPTREGLVKLSVWQKVKFSFTKFLPTLYIPSLPTNYKECFSERKL